MISNHLDLVIKLVKELNPEDLNEYHITGKTSLDEIGFDSISFMNLLLSLEDEINIDLEEIASEINPTEINTINDIVVFIEKLLKENKAC